MVDKAAALVSVVVDSDVVLMVANVASLDSIVLDINALLDYVVGGGVATPESVVQDSSVVLDSGMRRTPKC